mmetsp:Transcript_28358/g.65728  ORF Transcript_28358/g.65728 Transcript_28358/m.65728 type:complete len:801 (-) Transcript_28358:195-2597(-)
MFWQTCCSPQINVCNCDVNPQDEKGDAAVVENATGLDVWAALEGDDLPRLRQLVVTGVDVNMPNPSSTPRSRNATPLIVATRLGKTEAVKVLLTAPDLEINATTDNEVQTNRSKQTALHWAARENRGEITSLLLSHPLMDVNAQTAMGFQALFIAVQEGFLDVVDPLLKDDRTDVNYVWSPHAALQLSAVKVAMWDGHTEVVKRLLDSGRLNPGSVNEVTFSPDAKNTLITDAANLGHPAIVKVLLDHNADASIVNSKGLSTLEVALDADNTEIVMLLLSAGIRSTKVWSPLRQAQHLGDAQEVRLLVKQANAAGSTLEGEMLPKIHRAVLENNEEELSKEISSLASSGVSVAEFVDGGDFPPVFWAIELGQWSQVKKLLTTSHGMSVPFVDKLLSGGFAAIEKTPSAFPGDRSFEVFRSLLADDAKLVSEGKEKAKGAFALLKPYCASVAALRYFQKHPDHYDWLREACAQGIGKIYKAIDEEVGPETLEKVGLVAMSENQLGFRQDDPGLLPELKYFKDEAKGQTIAGNAELFVARSIALVALAFNEVFMADMRVLMKPYLEGGHAKMAEPPPKNYRRMYNKLMNVAEHGDPTLQKPRPAKNVDVNRFCLSVSDPASVEKIFNTLKSKYKILRIKNSHSPTLHNVYCYRSLLVNFAYDPGLTWGELVGSTGGYDAPNDRFQASDARGKAWLDYCQALTPSWDWSWGLEGLWRAGRLEPDRKVVWAGEVQIIMEPYMRGRHLSHLLYKISRCETGPSEMSRDFAGSFQEETQAIKSTRLALLKMVAEARDSSSTLAKGQ